MKKNDLLRGMVVLVISLVMGIGVLNVSLSYGADRLVIKNGSGTTTLTMTEDGMAAFGIPGATGTAGVGARSWEPMRMDIGYGGVGGGNLEAYSKDHSDPDRKGKFKFVYGGGDFGGVDYVHYDPARPEGLKWLSMMMLDKDGHLYMAGGAYTDGHSWIPSSSRENKENIRGFTVAEAVEVLEGLNPLKFNYKTGAKEDRVGFVAEEVPELVATKDRKGVSSMDVVAVLTKVVQEQQKTIAELSERLKELERNPKAPIVVSIDSLKE